MKKPDRPISNPNGSHEMDTTRKEKNRSTQGDMEKIGGERNERPRVDLGPGAALGRRQTALAFVGEDLMC